jgi:hypothetical protein
MCSRKEKRKLSTIHHLETAKSKAQIPTKNSLTEIVGTNFSHLTEIS